MAVSVDYNGADADTWNIRNLSEIDMVTIRELLQKEQVRVIKDIINTTGAEDLAFLGHQLGRVSNLLSLLTPSALYKETKE